MAESLRQMHHDGPESWRHTTLSKSNPTMQELYERRQAAFQRQRLQYDWIMCQHVDEAEDEIDCR